LISPGRQQAARLSNLLVGIITAATPPEPWQTAQGVPKPRTMEANTAPTEKIL
jgi:hypothetical protein